MVIWLVEQLQQRGSAWAARGYGGVAVYPLLLTAEDHYRRSDEPVLIVLNVWRAGSGIPGKIGCGESHFGPT